MLFLENVRNVCKAGSSKFAFRLKAQSSRETTAWALALDNVMAQSAAVRISAAAPFPPTSENIFDKYKQTEVHRHNQQSHIHSAVSAKSGNESTASSAVQSFGHAAHANSKIQLEFPSDSSVHVLFANFFVSCVASLHLFRFDSLPCLLTQCFQSAIPRSPQEAACSLLR